MTTQTIYGAQLWFPWISTGTASLLMDAAGEMVAMAVQIPKTGNIAKFHARIATVTSSQSLTGSVQSLDASGLPDGTPIQSGTHAVPASNTWATFDFGTDYAATKGQFKAFVIAWTGTAGNLNIAADNATLTLRAANNYPLLFTASWAKQARTPIVILEYDDGSFAHLPGAVPGVTTNVDYNTGSTPDEAALRFSLPIPMTVSGIMYAGRMNGDVDLVLYSGTTALATCSIDKDFNVGTGDGVFMGLFETPQALTASTVYRAAVKPSTATSVRLFYFDASSNNWLDQYDGGKECYWSQRTDAGAWSDTTTRRPQIGLIVSGLADDAGGGGGLAHPVGRWM